MICTQLFRAAGLLAFTVGLSSITPAAATDQAGYPDIDGFHPVSSTFIYQVTNRTGVWFTTPLGIRCAIEEDGSFGCSGDLPGTPPGIDEVAWFTGDPFPRLYHAVSPRFSSGELQTIVPESSFIGYRGSRCAVTRASAVYCISGHDPDSQIMVTSASTLRGRAALPST